MVQASDRPCIYSDFRKTCISRTAGCRVKRGETWELGVQCTQGTFDTKVVKVILGSLGAFPIFDKPVSRKWLVVERNGVKFGPLG